jgi:uncharacterized protein YjbI with pentapeptide repeats
MDKCKILAVAAVLVTIGLVAAAVIAMSRYDTPENLLLLGGLIGFVGALVGGLAEAGFSCLFEELRYRRDERRRWCRMALAWADSEEKESLRRAGLRGADLRGVNLEGADLSHADLSKANLFCANLKKADLSSASLRGSHLTHADLAEAELFKTDLSKSVLYVANLDKANLGGADLSKVDLSLFSAL